MYRIAICDDNDFDRNRLKEIVKIAADCQQIGDITYYLYASGHELLCEMEIGFDAIFLDVQMDGMNGNETAEQIRKTNTQVILVFCTGVQIPTPEAFRVQPYRYIMKQFKNDEIICDVKAVILKIADNKKKYLVVIRNGNMVKVQFDDILYIENTRRGSNIHMCLQGKNAEQQIQCAQKLDELYGELDQRCFVYAHNSYIVNLIHVLSATRAELVLDDNITLSIARSKTAEFHEALTEYYARK